MLKPCTLVKVNCTGLDGKQYQSSPGPQRQLAYKVICVWALHVVMKQQVASCYGKATGLSGCHLMQESNTCTPSLGDACDHLDCAAMHDEIPLATISLISQ
jgi:hypothetical protein